MSPEDQSGARVGLHVVQGGRWRRGSWNMGKESTSVGRSTPRCSRLMAWMPSSSVNSTSTSQGKDTPSASSAAGITRRSSPA